MKTLERWGFVTKNGFFARPSDLAGGNAYIEGAPEKEGFFTVGESPIIGPVTRFDADNNVVETERGTYSLGSVSPTFQAFFDKYYHTLKDYADAIGGQR